MIARFTRSWTTRRSCAKCLTRGSMAMSADCAASLIIDTHCHVHVSSECESTSGSQPRQGTIAAGRLAADCGLCIPRAELSRGSSTGDIHQDVTVGGGVKERCQRHARRACHESNVAYIVMGIRESDWAQAAAFSSAIFSSGADASVAGKTDDNMNEEDAPRARTATFFRFGVGLHPWYAHARTAGWLRQLESLLTENPRALVGEIGLDKVARTPDTQRVEWNDQLEVFEKQMALAAQMSRPTSVHCVKAYGKLLDFLRRGMGERRKAKIADDQHSADSKGKIHLPPRIALHGSYEGYSQVRHLANERIIRNFREPLRSILQPRLAKRGAPEIFFGFSAAVNMRSDRERQRLLDLLGIIPDSQILMETDRRSPAADAVQELELVRVAISEAKGCTLDEALALANDNARRFLAAAPSTHSSGDHGGMVDCSLSYSEAFPR